MNTNNFEKKPNYRETERVIPKRPVTEPEVTENTTTTNVTEPEVTESKPVYGVVSGCVKLRVRKEPSTKGAVLTEIPGNTKVQITLIESTDDWYKVSVNGTNGFCMKRYISVD